MQIVIFVILLRLIIRAFYLINISEKVESSFMIIIFVSGNLRTITICSLMFDQFTILSMYIATNHKHICHIDFIFFTAQPCMLYPNLNFDINYTSGHKLRFVYYYFLQNTYKFVNYKMYKDGN